MRYLPRYRVLDVPIAGAFPWFVSGDEGRQSPDARNDMMEKLGRLGPVMHRVVPVESTRFEAQRQPGERQFEDSRGLAWRVFQYSGPRRNGDEREVLMFDCAVAFRCVSTYPANWRELPAEALETLSWMP